MSDARVQPDVVMALIALGRGGEPAIPPLLADERKAWRLLMIGQQPWRDLATRLSINDLRAVIRGLVFYARASDWSGGGSVSPVIDLYRVFVERDPHGEPELTAWIVDNRNNDYEPFGTTLHGGARTLMDLRAHQLDRARVRAQGLIRDQERQRLDALMKADRATARIAAAVRRGDVAAVRALMRAGGDIRRAEVTEESLLQIAKVNERPKMVEFLESLGFGERDPR